KRICSISFSGRGKYRYSYRSPAGDPVGDPLWSGSYSLVFTPGTGRHLPALQDQKMVSKAFDSAQSKQNHHQRLSAAAHEASSKKIYRHFTHFDFFQIYLSDQYQQLFYFLS